MNQNLDILTATAFKANAFGLQSQITGNVRNSIWQLEVLFGLKYCRTADFHIMMAGLTCEHKHTHT